MWVRGPGGRQHELVIVLVRSLMGAISGRRPLGLTSRLRASCPLCRAGGRLACDSCVHYPSVGGTRSLGHANWRHMQGHTWPRPYRTLLLISIIITQKTLYRRHHLRAKTRPRTWDRDENLAARVHALHASYIRRGGER